MRLSRALAGLVLSSVLPPMLMACQDDRRTAVKEAHDPVQFRRVLDSSTSSTGGGLSAPGAAPTSTGNPLPLDCAATPDNGPGGQPDATTEAIACDEAGVVYRLSPAEIVGGVERSRAELSQHGGGWVVSVELDDEATRSFDKISTELSGTGMQFAVLFDGAVLSAPTVETPIADGRLEISGNFKQAEARDLAAGLDP